MSQTSSYKLSKELMKVVRDTIDEHSTDKVIILCKLDRSIVSNIMKSDDYNEHYASTQVMNFIQWINERTERVLISKNYTKIKANNLVFYTKDDIYISIYKIVKDLDNNLYSELINSTSKYNT